MTQRSAVGRAFFVLGWALKLAFAATAVLLPLAGVWIASSLAAHHDGPLWASLVAGALCFPLLPIAWDLIGTWKRHRRGETKPRVLTPIDRLVLRTLAINSVFVGGLLLVFPASTFEALSTRGDWMLEHVDAPWADDVRRDLFSTAERLKWLHEATHENEYEDLIDPSLTRTHDGTAPKAGKSTTTRTPLPSTGPAVSPSDLQHEKAWPFAPTIHPAVLSIPPESETSIKGVAQYLIAQEPDPVLRVKALHDYVADRVAYDVPALSADRFPPQDADTVFRTHTAVCAGYATLLAALGEAAGIEIVVVVGDSRGDDGLFDGRGHAWNAVNLDGSWYLIDATWNAGHVNGDTFTKKYGTDYFLTPPEAFITSHLPDDANWQLLDEPLSHGDFLRVPALRPGFTALDLELLDPVRARHSVRQGESLTFQFANPHAFRIVGSIRGEGETQGDRCDVNTERTQMECTFDDVGREQVVLFGPEGVYLGQIYVDVG